MYARCGFILRLLHRRSRACFFFRFLAGGVIQWHREASKFIERRCGACAGAPLMDTSHFVLCPRFRRERAGATTRLCEILAQEGGKLLAIATRYTVIRGDCLRMLLVDLRFLSATNPATESAALLGAFNSAAASNSLRTFDIQRERRPALIASIRSILFSWVARAWSSFCI